MATWVNGMAKFVGVFFALFTLFWIADECSGPGQKEETTFPNDAEVSVEAVSSTSTSELAVDLDAWISALPESTQANGWKDLYPSLCGPPRPERGLYNSAFTTLACALFEPGEIAETPYRDVFNVPQSLNVWGYHKYVAFNLRCASGVEGNVHVWVPLTPTSYEHWTGRWRYPFAAPDGIVGYAVYVYFGPPLPEDMEHRRAPAHLDLDHWTQADSAPYVVIDFGYRGWGLDTHRIDLQPSVPRPADDDSYVALNMSNPYFRVSDALDPEASQNGPDGLWLRQLGDTERIPLRLAAELGTEVLLSDASCSAGD